MVQIFEQKMSGESSDNEEVELDLEYSSSESSSDEFARVFPGEGIEDVEVGVAFGLYEPILTEENTEDAGERDVPRQIDENRLQNTGYW